MVQKDESFDGEKKDQFPERKVYNKDEVYFSEGSARWSGHADVIVEVVWLSEFGVQTLPLSWFQPIAGGHTATA